MPWVQMFRIRTFDLSDGTQHAQAWMHSYHLVNQMEPQLSDSYPQINCCQFSIDWMVGECGGKINQE